MDQPIAAAALNERTYAQVTRAAIPTEPWQGTATGVSGAYGRSARAAQPAPPAPAQRDAWRSAGTRPGPSVLGPRGEFIGACFKCQAVGHRASECPEVICYICQQKGHISRECRERRASNPSRPQGTCECCGKPGVSFLNCRNALCISLRAMAGNACSGGPSQ